MAKKTSKGMSKAPGMHKMGNGMMMSDAEMQKMMGGKKKGKK